MATETDIDTEGAISSDEEHAHSHENMSPEEEHAHMIDNFKKAGKLTAKVREDGKRLIVPGESLFDVAESVEKFMAEAGIRMGFPANISLNNAAAHFTPEIGCETLLGEKDVVKLDIGGQVEGCVGDTACTIDLSDEWGKMAECTQAALADAIALAKPGVATSELGTAIEERIKAAGFKPIENLCGHKIEPYALHAGIDIPNVRTPPSYVLQEGDIFAIEPFATNGSGRVHDGTQVEIFSLVSGARVRMRQSRQLLSHIATQYFTLPFAERWLVPNFKSRLLLSSALKELLNAGALRPYPVLLDTPGSIVAQTEHTILIEHDSALVLTQP
ncbi:type II methionyl aminopeptidase [Candidatus Micrarchaeota archaeon]|nr:type II methionyl aminopeptidase [Candidatus Micrarchaeota archaeon]